MTKKLLKYASFYLLNKNLLSPIWGKQLLSPVLNHLQMSLQRQHFIDRPQVLVWPEFEPAAYPICWAYQVGVNFNLKV